MKKGIKIRLLLLSSIFCIQTSVLGYGFVTLREMQKYAQQVPEKPPIDNDNWFQPDYSSFFREIDPSWIDLALMKWGLKSRPIWRPIDFKQLIVEVTRKREQDGYSDRYIMHMTPKEEDTFVIWGDLEGAFHSLVRDLAELERRGIINDDLKIMHPNIYFVFNGNVVNRSAYSMETLTIVMRLMLQNKHKVIYIRGRGEDRERWYDLGLKTELERKGWPISDKKIPLDNEVKRFFNTLPLALYLIVEDTEDAVTVVRIVNHAIEEAEIDEGMIGDFFEQDNRDRPAIYKVFDRKKTSKKIIVASQIKGENRSASRYTPTKGLVRLGFSEGGIIWSVLSAPTSAYRNLYNFFYDAFTVLKVKKAFDEWTLTLYNQDVRDQNGFLVDAAYYVGTGFDVIKKKPLKKFVNQVELLQQKLNELEKELASYQESCPVALVQEEKIAEVGVAPVQLVSLAAIEQQSSGVRDKKILLGTTGDLEKGLKGYTDGMRSGNDFVFSQVNKSGGFRGKLFELISLNDNYEPSFARENVIRFLRDIGIDIIFNPIGSSTTISYLDLIKDKKLLVLFPHSGALDLRSPSLPYVINFQVSYYSEGEVLARYAIEKTHAHRFAIVYQNDSYGIPPRDGILRELKKKKIPRDHIMQISYDRNNVNLREQADQLQKFGPDAIFFLSTAAWAKSLIRYLGAGYFAGKHIFALSLLSTKEFTNFMNYKGLQIIFTAQTPSPEYSDLQIVQEFRQAAQKNDVEIDVPALEGYIAAELLMYLLNRIADDVPLSKEAIVAAAQSINREEYKGLKLHFDKETNQINTYMWLRTKSGKDWKSIDTLMENI